VEVKGGGGTLRVMSHDGGDDDAFVEPPKSVADHRLSLNRSVDANKPVQHLPGGGADGYDSDVIPSRPETLRQMVRQLLTDVSYNANMQIVALTPPSSLLPDL
jgi:hypothetical protein